jgi:serine/threonine protein phosphatase PrpC
MSINRRRALAPGDVLLACTDGLWASLDEEAIASAFAGGVPLQSALATLSEHAVINAGAASDNTSAAALRFLE